MYGTEIAVPPHGVGVRGPSRIGPRTRPISFDWLKIVTCIFSIYLLRRDFRKPTCYDDDDNDDNNRHVWSYQVQSILPIGNL